MEVICGRLLGTGPYGFEPTEGNRVIPAGRPFDRQHAAPHVHRDGPNDAAERGIGGGSVNLGGLQSCAKLPHPGAKGPSGGRPAFLKLPPLGLGGIQANLKGGHTLPGGIHERRR